MPNELERLLDLACSEPGYAPEFYRCLLASEVHALIPTSGHGLDEGKMRFVMWRGADGIDVIPYFASHGALRRALKPGWQSVAFTGQAFLKLTRGAIVVLNPNEAATSRLTPAEVAMLLDTGAVSNPERESRTDGWTRLLQPVATPPTATLHSLSVLFSRHPNVLRAYVVHCAPLDAPEARCYLIVIRMHDHDAERLARESAQVMLDVPPDLGTDLIMCFDDTHEVLQQVAGLAAPFYDQAWGQRLVVPESTRPT